MKHGSPTTEKRTKAVDAGDMGSMPSLAASSSDTSPGERGDDSLAKAPLHDQEDTDGNSGVNVNTLLMAAYAMTEFQSQPRKDNATKIPPKEDDETLDQKAPPRQSPKRKSSEVLGPDVAKSEDHQAAEAAAKQFALKDDDDAKSSSPMEPVDPREMKRTRLGSARENTNRNMDDGVNHGSPDNSGPTSDRAAFMQETPDQKTMGGDKLTPVSARCIDFKRMHMNEKGKVERS